MAKSKIVFGNGLELKEGQGFAVRTNVFIGGIPEAEWEKQQGMVKRQLMKTDIPNEPWREEMDKYLLREDGAILSDVVPVELGFVQPDGTVAWTQL